MKATDGITTTGDTLTSPLLRKPASDSSTSSPLYKKTADMLTIHPLSTDRSDWTAACTVDDTFQGLDRRARYQRMYQLMAEREEQIRRGDKRLLRHASSVWLRARNRMAYVQYFFLHNASLACVAWLAFGCCHSISLALLLPPYMLHAAITAWTATTDRAVCEFRLRLRRKASRLRLFFFEIYVVICLGVFFGWLFIKGRRVAKAEFSFLTELEEFDASRRAIAIKPRFETHLICIWGAPLILACAYIIGTVPLTIYDGLAVAVLLGNGVVTVTLGFVNFDFSTSRFIREGYGTKWDGNTWVQQDRHLFFVFRKLHQAYRLLRVVMRALVFTAASMASLSFPWAVLAIGVLDYLWSVAILSSKSRQRTWKLAVLGIGIFLADPCRFVDEPGYALPAQQTSFAVLCARVLEMALAAVVFARCSFPDAEAWAGPLGGWPSKVLLASLLCCALLHFYSGRMSPLSRQGGDLFTAVAQGDVDAVEDILTGWNSAECTVNLRLQDSSLRTALHLAVELGQAECARCLMRNGADATLQDAQGDTAMHRAARAGDLPLAEILLQPADGDEETLDSGLRSLLRSNKSRQTPVEVLAKAAPRELRQLLEEKTRAARKELRVCFSSRGDTAGVERELSASVFGKMVGGEAFHISYGQLNSPASADFPTFLLLRGLGDNLSQLYEDFHEWRSGCCVRLSCLRIARTLGEGSFGKVLQVQDLRSGQFYAMKLQRKTFATKCAVREAVALHSTQHPFIIRVMHVFHTTALFGILMEFCEMDLNKRIFEYGDEAGRVRGLPLAKSARYTACMTLALEHLHSRSIVFCDLKPENVLTTSEAEGDIAKLADFGLARSVGSLDAESLVVEQKSGQRAGTPAFLPSEVWRSSPKIQTEDDFMDFFTMRDWYALGCCLLLMLLGEFGGTKAFASGRHVLLPLAQDEVPAVLARANEMPGVDADALGLVADLMAPEPSARAGPAELRRSGLLRDVIASLEEAFPCE